MMSKTLISPQVEANDASLQSALFPLLDCADIYADSLVWDTYRKPLFISIWGRDTAIREFQSRLTLAPREGGLANLTFLVEGRRLVLDRFNPDEVIQKTARCADHHCLFGELVHAWYYADFAAKIDKANQRALYLIPKHKQNDAISAYFWKLVQETSHLPLLDHWRKPVLQKLQELGWIKPLDSVGHLKAILLDLSDETFEMHITQLVQAGVLRPEAV